MVVVHYNPLYSDDNPSINVVLLIDLFWVNYNDLTVLPHWNHGLF